MTSGMRPLMKHYNNEAQALTERKEDLMTTKTIAPIDQAILKIADSKIEEATEKLNLLKPDSNEFDYYQTQLLVGIRLQQLVENDY